MVIFHDGQAKQEIDTPEGPSNSHEDAERKESYNGYSDPNYFLMHILSYLETPPYLRKCFFPMHPDLRLAGKLPSLDMPHHLKRQEWCQYREGVTVAGNPDREKQRKKIPRVWKKPFGHTLVDTGLHTRVFLPETILPNTRVTVKFQHAEPPSEIPSNELLAEVVAPSSPRIESGYYWGYDIRSASSLSAVLTECPFDGGYDITFGTSERGIPLSTLNDPNSEERSVPEFSHMMIVFGGVAGLEVAVKADKELEKLNVKKPETMFDYWLDICPGQGSRTIRTEEAVWLGLMGLKDIVQKKGRK